MFKASHLSFRDSPLFVAVPLSLVTSVLVMGCSGDMEGVPLMDETVQGVEFPEGLSGSDADAAGDNSLHQSVQAELAPELGILEQPLVGSCGTTSSTADAVLSLAFAPDFFPPEVPGAAGVFAVLGADPVTLTACATLFGKANMRPACDAHDACYSDLNQTKASCDQQARRDWKKPCKRYDSFFGTACEALCKTQAEAMFEAVARTGQGAFDTAQAQSRAKTGPDVVKMRTVFTGSNQCLDIVNSSSRSQLQMATCANVTGQSWVAQPTPTASTFKFQTSFSGSGRCLDIVGGRPQMAACGNFSGQLWTMHPVEGRPGAFRLTNAFTGVGQCLDIIDGEPAMAPCGDFTGQFWLPRDQ